MKPVATFEGKKGRVHVIGVVKGLVSEGTLVGRLISKRKPKTVALGISAEEIDGLRKIRADGGIETVSMTRYEENYAAGLSRFGRVAFPSPCFAEAVAVSDDMGVKVADLDLPEEKFTDAYCKNVSAFNLMFHSARLPVMDRMRPKGATAEEFATWWDGIVEGSAGFDMVQRARERHMASRIGELDGESLAFIEIARAGKVAALLGKKPVEAARDGKGLKSADAAGDGRGFKPVDAAKDGKGLD